MEKGKRFYKIAVLCFVLLLGAGLPLHAAASSSDSKAASTSLKEAEKEKEALEEELEAAKQAVADLKESKGNVEEKLAALNIRLMNISERITALEGQLEEKNRDISETQEELEEAKQVQAQQYEDMKLRIQFMYENGNVPVWQLLMEAASLSEFLNRTEYISEINQYDRKKLEEYQLLQEQIAEQKKALEDDMEQLVAMRDDMQQKQDSVNSLIQTTKSNIAQADQNLADAIENVTDIDRAIAKMVEYEKQLEIQKAKEDAARLAAIREQEQEDTSGVVYVPTDSDAYLLGAIIQCESDGEPYEGKLAVGSVVLNRVKSSYFPNTISGVIYQDRQFSPVASGRLAYRLEAGVNSTCLQAAQEVLNGNITINALYFRTNNGIIQGTVIGNHVFY